MKFTNRTEYFDKLVIGVQELADRAFETARLEYLLAVRAAGRKITAEIQAEAQLVGEAAVASRKSWLLARDPEVAEYINFKSA